MSDYDKREGSVTLPDLNPGWYEFIMSGGATTHIGYAYEDGSVYLPEGPDVVSERDFRVARETERFWRLVREAEILAEPPKADDDELAEQFRKGWMTGHQSALDEASGVLAKADPAETDAPSSIDFIEYADRAAARAKREALGAFAEVLMKVRTDQFHDEGKQSSDPLPQAALTWIVDLLKEKREQGGDGR